MKDFGILELWKDVIFVLFAVLIVSWLVENEDV
jgi:hypothetical protein